MPVIGPQKNGDPRLVEHSREGCSNVPGCIFDYPCATSLHPPTAPFPRIPEDRMASASVRPALVRFRVPLLAIALVVRALYVLFAVSEIRRPETPGHFNIETGDAQGYLQPIESVLAGGDYMPDYRMPGVGAVYWVFRQFLDIGASRDAMVVLQWLLSALSVYLLALLAMRISGSQRLGFLVYVLFLLSAYSSWYDPFISSDSWATSSLIISAYLVQRAVDQGSMRTLACAGLVFTWFVFLRPVGAALLPVLAFLIWRHGAWPKPVMAMVALLAPFLVIDSLWTARNWRATGNLRPLTNQGLLPSDFTNEVTGHTMAFIQCYGGNYIWWAPGSDMRWFGIWKGGAHLDDEGRLAQPPPDHAIVPGYTRDSLFLISERIRATRLMAPADSIAEIAKINAKLDYFSGLYRQQAPFNYHVMSRLRMFKNLVGQHGAESIILRPFASLPLWMKVFKAMQSFFYIFAYTMGSVAVIMLLWGWRRAPSLSHIWIPVVVAYLMTIYPIVLRMCEWRYMVHGFPFALLLATWLCWRIAGKLGMEWALDGARSSSTVPLA